MEYKAERTLPKAVKQNADVVFDVASKIPPEKQAAFLEFWRGVDYGLEMANRQPRPEPSQASA